MISPVRRFGRHGFFQIDAESVADPVDVSEVGRHLYRIVNRFVVETMFSQCFDVGLFRSPWSLREADTIVEQCPHRRFKFGCAVIGFDSFDQVFVGDLNPEVGSVGLGSVMTIVCPRNDGGNHLPLCPR